MKKGRGEVATTSKDNLINNGMGGIGDKVCLSAGWKEEMVNRRACDTLRWMLGRS